MNRLTVDSAPFPEEHRFKSDLFNSEPENIPTEPDTLSEEDRQEASRRVSVRIPNAKPIVTWILCGVTVIIYLIQVGTQQFMGTDLPLALGAKYGPLIRLGQWWRLFTPIFLHGSILHILFNMYALIILGREIEPAYGHRDFLIFYLITGFAGNVFSFVFSPQTVSVGASTSLFGLIAAQGFLIYHNKKFIRNYQRAINNVIFVVVINLVLGMQSGIDNWGHLGGLISGVIIAFLAGPAWDIRINSSQNGLELYDKVTPSKRLIAFLLTFLLFASLAFAFR